MFSPCSWQEDSMWGGVLWLRGWRWRRPQKRCQLQESQESQNWRRERGRRKGEERWGGNKRYLFIFFHFHLTLLMSFCNIWRFFVLPELSQIILYNTEAVLLWWLWICLFFFLEVKEEEKVPEEEKMDTSKWENTSHTKLPCCPESSLLGALIISSLWVL